MYHLNFHYLAGYNTRTNILRCFSFTLLHPPMFKIRPTLFSPVRGRSISLETAEIIPCCLAKLQATSLKPGQGQHSPRPLFTLSSLQISMLRPQPGEMMQGTGKYSGTFVLTPARHTAKGMACVFLTLISKHCSFDLWSVEVTRCYTRQTKPPIQLASKYMNFNKISQGSFLKFGKSPW